MDAVEAFEREALSSNSGLAALHAASSTAAVARMRTFVTHGGSPSWPGATSASALRRAAQEAEVVAVLDEYKTAAGSLIAAATDERWRALVSQAQRLSGRGVLVDELGRHS